MVCSLWMYIQSDVKYTGARGTFPRDISVFPSYNYSHNEKKSSTADYTSECTLCKQLYQYCNENPGGRAIGKMASSKPFSPDKTIVLVGLMGAGKTCIGSLLADRLCLPFIDADDEIEAAAGCSISDIFDLYGESEFRAGERRVIARLLRKPKQVLATGGGAFIDPETRKIIAKTAISIWLRADLDLLASRTIRRADRPLLAGNDHRRALKKLMEIRYPLYAEADMIVDSRSEPPETTVEKLISTLKKIN